MNCRKCGSLLYENEVVCRMCGENNSFGVNNSNYINQNFNQSIQQPMYGIQNNQYVQPPKKNGTFTVIFIVLLLIIIGLGGFVGYNLLFKNETKPVEEKKIQISDNKEDDKDDKDDKENEVIATNVNYYEIYEYKFPVPKELTSLKDATTINITDNTSFQLQFSLSTDSYSSVIANPEYYKQEFEKMGLTIERDYERKYVGKSFYLFKVINNGTLALLYLTEVDDNVVGIGVIMATSLSAYETGLNCVSRMITNSSKTSNFSAGENSEVLINGPKINKDIFNNAKIDSVEFTG